MKLLNLFTGLPLEREDQRVMIHRDLKLTKSVLFTLLFVASGCTAQKPPSSPSPTGGTTRVPASYYTTYYSTQKARSLGETYSENLDHILDQLTRSSIGQLQFANAVVSLSVGFFTHAASQPPDERYLEAIIGMPDILDEEKDFSTLVEQLFSDYGRELLSTMAQDETIARDMKIAGYGLHFSWRSLLKTPSGPRLSMREAVLYLAKNQTQQFLNQQITQDMLLTHATLFSRQGERPAELVQYVSPAQSPQLPSPIPPDSQEDPPTLSLYDPEPPQEIQPSPIPETDGLQYPPQPVESVTRKELNTARKSKGKLRALTAPSAVGQRRQIIIRRPSHNTTAIIPIPTTEGHLSTDPASR